MKRIPLTLGYFTIVDDEDFEYLNQWKWHARDTGKNIYAIRRDYSFKTPRWIRMHRLLLNATGKVQVDHINRYSLDNRRCNLRLCNNRQNHYNIGLRKDSTSGLKGVNWLKRNRKWRSRIKVNGKEINLGCYRNKREAALAYNLAASRYFGQFAVLNQI